MIQVIAIHPSILSASQNIGGTKQCREATDNSLRYEDAYKQFSMIQQRIVDAKKRIHENTVLRDRNITIKIPSSEKLIVELDNVPPWNQKSSHRLKRTILKFFRTHQVTLKDQQQEYICQIINPNSSFPYNISPSFLDAWCETVTAARCKQEWADLNVCDEIIFAVWCNHKNNCAGHIIEFDTSNAVTNESASLNIPIISVNDDWQWERTLRQHLWQDARLPFWGSPFDTEESEEGFEPRFGFQPTDQWEVGSKPRKDRNGCYIDRFGARWKWGKRARTDRHPFEGHWDVQLDDPNAKTSWRKILEEAYDSIITFKDTHINIEPDGSITDKSVKLTQKS